MRTLIDYLPFAAHDAGKSWHRKGLWPYRWINGGDAGNGPHVSAYRRVFTIDEAMTIRAHVSGDERYELYVDGQLIGRGSERGDASNWYFETYDLTFQPGQHVIVAKVWSLGAMAPYAQMSVRHGFILAPEGGQGHLIGTGAAQWQYKRVTGITMIDPRPDSARARTCGSMAKPIRGGSSVARGMAGAVPLPCIMAPMASIAMRLVLNI